MSAVDTNVGKHIFEKCIKGNVKNNIALVSIILKHLYIIYVYVGYLKEKTCILITHQLQHLTKVDQVVLLENVSIIN